MNQPNRKSRRTEAAQQRRHNPPTSGDLVARLARLEQISGAFQQVTSENARHVINGFALVDRHVIVMYRVQNDMQKSQTYSNGGIEVTTDFLYRDKDGNVDYDRYHLESAAIGVIVNLFTTIYENDHKLEQPAEPELAAHGLVPLPDFGGDNAVT